VPVRGILTLPGDKSISHRALMISSLIDGKNYIKNLSTSNDVKKTLNCLNALGVRSCYENDILVVEGNTLGKPNKDLDCGNSGTTMRLLAGLIGGLNIPAKLTGDQSLSKRPMYRIINPLQDMQVNITCNKNNPPIIIKKTNNLINLSYNQEVASAQVKSSLLLCGLSANRRIIIHEEIKTRNHTEIMLKHLGANINTHNGKITLNPLNQKLNNLEVEIPGDISSASFFIGAACMIPNSDLIIKDVLVNDSRIGFIKALQKMGAGIEINNKRMRNGEPIGDIGVFYKPLHAINLDKDTIPYIIDELPILAVVATQAEGATIIAGAEELRYKESDRIHTLCSNLKAMGVTVIEKKDGFIIEGPAILSNANIKSYDDHRIAMAFIIAGISSGNYNTIDNIECINSSFPEFIDTLKTIIR